MVSDKLLMIWIVLCLILATIAIYTINSFDEDCLNRPWLERHGNC